MISDINIDYIKQHTKKMLYVDNGSLILGYFIYFIIFLIYLELSPKLKNIWIRCDSDNILKICPSGIISMLKKPFTDVFFWYPQFWDINYYVGGYLFSNALHKISNIIYG